jgi:hypothetical protein
LGEICDDSPFDGTDDCVCFAPPPCTDISDDGPAICFGTCPEGPAGQSRFCVFSGLLDGCRCADVPEICQPQDGMTCGGLCPGEGEECLPTTIPPNLFGCRCGQT